MARPPKKEIEYWNAPRMVEYAFGMYPELEKLNKHCEGIESNIKRHIQRSLKEYNFTKVKNNGTDQYQVPVELAHYIMNFMLRDYILDYIAGSKDKLKQLQEEKYEQYLKEVEELSAKRDSEMQERFLPLELAQQLLDLADDEEEQMRLLERFYRGTWWQENVEAEFITLSNGHKIHRNALKYHIPDMSLEKLDDDTVERIVDRVMLRSIFSQFFEFDEEAFRRDLYERAAHINTETEWKNIPKLGHGALEQRLEDPLTYYVKPKQVTFQTNRQATQSEKSSSSNKEK